MATRQGSRQTWRLLAAAIITAAAWLALAPLSLAAPSPDPTAGCSGSWSTTTGEGEPLVIDCSPGFASDHDRIYVYPRHRSPHPADWRQALDMTDSIWLFNVGAGDRTSLMIDFHGNPGQPGVEADLYDDQAGKGKAIYRLSSGFPVPTAEPPLPTVRVVAPDGWWLQDGRINYNLDITVDGAVETGWASNLYLKSLHTDGRIDFDVTVRDPDKDGRPDWEYVRAFPPLPSDSGVPRSVLMVSPHGDQPVQHYLFWPFLAGTPWGLVQPYDDRLPPVQMDWQTGKITTIGEFVASRGAPSNWFTYSLAPFAVETSAYADFENPFAFYDLANKNDGYPDLAIRHAYTGPQDPFSDIGPIDQPLDLVRYSWDQQHSHIWTYKVDLQGRNKIDTSVRLGPLIVDTVPYDDLPGWVLSRPWDMVDFVANEGGGGWTSEGMYASPLPARSERFVIGQDSKPISTDEWKIDPGFRTDFLAQPGSHAELYVSSIDHELHLLHAQGGTWNLGGGRELRYVNLGGAYLNRWELRAGGDVQEALNFVGGQLINETSSGVRLRTIASAPALFTSEPPRDHQSWAELGARLSADKGAFAGTDLTAMFDQFSGPVQVLTGARMWDLRLASGGFSFAIQLGDASAAAPPWQGLKPGSYFARYQMGSGYNVTPLAPAALTFGQPQVFTEHLAALAPAQLSLDVSNSGTDDARNVKVGFAAVDGKQPAVEVGSVSLDIPGGASRVARVTWVPPRPGQWVIRASVADDAGVKPAREADVRVPPSPQANLLGLQAAAQLGFRLASSAGAFLGVTVLAGLIAGAALARTRSRRQSSGVQR